MIYASGANGKGAIDVSIPARIQNGKYYNNDHSLIDFRGEGFGNGTKYKVLAETKNLNRKNGSDQDSRIINIPETKVQDGVLKAKINNIQSSLKLNFEK